MPDQNPKGFENLMSVAEYKEAFDSMVGLLQSQDQDQKDLGDIMCRNHERYPQTFANVWLRKPSGSDGMSYE